MAALFPRYVDSILDVRLIYLDVRLIYCASTPSGQQAKFLLSVGPSLTRRTANRTSPLETLRISRNTSGNYFPPKKLEIRGIDLVITLKFVKFNFPPENYTATDNARSTQLSPGASTYFLITSGIV